MRKFFLLLTSIALCAIATPTFAATTATAKAPAKKITTTVKKKVVVKKTTAKASYGTAKNPVFSPEAAALAMGNVPGGEAYQAALRKAEKDCIAAKGNKEKLEICDQEFRDAQALLGQ